MIRFDKAIILAGLLLLTASASFAVELPAIGADLHGFVDGRYGLRAQTDPTQKDQSLAETRLQLGLNRMGDRTTLQLRADFYYDDIVGQEPVRIEEGKGWVDLREANLLFSPHDLADVKLGRQILTWGTGDLLFINDLFPKDWQSFFIGRDEEYLKAPSDALLVSLFPEVVNIDLAYTPRFDPDRYIRGERLSYWNPLLGRLAGREAVIVPITPDRWFEDDELALRLSKNVAGYEVAFYGYDGFWKSPAGFDPVRAQATFPKLSVYGASLRGNVGKGIGHLEAGYYDSRDDRDGSDPFVPNSELRLMTGYEQEVVRDVTLSGQYYLEVLQDYGRYTASVPPGQPQRDEFRHLLTARLTWMLLNQNLTLSFFGFWSPSDDDGYLRPAVSYKLTDAWQLTAGGNLFAGRKQSSFFGQFENNSNVYAGVRFSF